MKLEFNLRPIPSNQRLIKSNRSERLILNPKYRQTKAETSIQLLPQRRLIREFAKSYNHEREAIITKWIIYTPKLFTKKGLISKVSMDLDGQTKLFQDVIFDELKKYNSQIDDAQVLTQSMQKVEGKDYRVIVEFGKFDYV